MNVSEFEVQSSEFRVQESPASKSLDAFCDYLIFGMLLAGIESAILGFAFLLGKWVWG